MYVYYGIVLPAWQVLSFLTGTKDPKTYLINTQKLTPSDLEALRDDRVTPAQIFVRALRTGFHPRLGYYYGFHIVPVGDSDTDVFLGKLIDPTDNRVLHGLIPLSPYEKLFDDMRSYLEREYQIPSPQLQFFITSRDY